MMSSGKPIRYMAESPPACGRPGTFLSDFRLGLQHLPALIHAGLEVDVVRAAQLARVLVLNVGRLLQRIRRTAHATPRGRGFFLRHGHGGNSFKIIGARGAGPSKTSGSRAYRGTLPPRLDPISGAFWPP